MVGPFGFTSYVVKNDKRIEDALMRARGIVTDLRPAFLLIKRDFQKSNRAIFSLKGPGKYPDFKGKKGKDGMTNYQRRKERITKLPKGYPLLKFSGALEESLTSDGDGSVTVIERQYAQFGSTISYLKYHQAETPGRGIIPIRKPLFIGPESTTYASNKELTGRAERWLNIINTYTLRQMGASFKQATGK